MTAVHEQVDERAREQDEPRQHSERVRTMLTDQEERGASDENDDGDGRPRRPPRPLGLALHEVPMTLPELAAGRTGCVAVVHLRIDCARIR